MMVEFRSAIVAALVLLFLISGSSKVSNIESFRNGVREYRDIPVILFSMDATPDEVMTFVSGHDLNCTIVALPTNELYVKVFEGEVTPFAFRLNERLQVLGKGLVNDLENLRHVAGLHSSAPSVVASAS